MRNEDQADRGDPGPEPGLPDQRAPDGRKRDYWSETPRFARMWAEHVSRWPGERADVAPDRSRDPVGSWRGGGNQYLSPEQHTRAKDVIAAVKEAEKPLSDQMREIERDNAYGSRLEGWQFRLKGDDRLKEKIAEKIEHEPRRTPAESMRGVNDAIRYTFCTEPATYVDACGGIRGMLEARGYEMTYSKNHWRDDPEYKGVNTRWVTPDGQRFEVQFHTPESLHAKQQITHNSYERVRNPLTPDDERGELAVFQRGVCSWIREPAGIPDIPDYPRRDR